MVVSPFNGVVIGMTTLPAVSPGEAVCHIGKLAPGAPRIEKLRMQLSIDSLHDRVVAGLATNVMVVDGPETNSVN
jgi:hypothetical protein